MPATATRKKPAAKRPKTARSPILSTTGDPSAHDAAIPATPVPEITDTPTLESPTADQLLDTAIEESFPASDPISPGAAEKLAALEAQQEAEQEAQQAIAEVETDEPPGRGNKAGA